MTTKLTLTVEKAVIDRAKLYARNTGRSLSELVERYLETITLEEGDRVLSPKLKSLVGAVKLPDDFDETTALREAFERKHFLK
ncbi:MULTISPECIES: DUF6364 family protein [unclassified Flavobacterium]|uniref:DUF6364 family protein n=1 Tax=unclassified Flavobacterium TaxID=196869 RepID=UPI001F12B6AA|nr:MULTISPECIES: DUF6364 family protein [unclassified Flavobacterium]UMY65674.1 DUF6364 family protein [Flavobacterium sp. HJ-32-4]HLN94557.1 DUF6364 family protein [Flavobacterium sp.]